MESEGWTPPALEVDKPHPARIYDYWLGGKDNYAPDRAAAEHAMSVSPDIPAAARENRAFLHRAVTMCAREGIRQFVDIGAGLPTQGNLHEIAQAQAPDARVVYVDNDPLVIAHGQALLIDNDATAVIGGDLRAPQGLLGDAELLALIDFRQPVAVLLLDVLPFVDDLHAAASVAALRERVAPGSLLLLSHSTSDGHPERAAEVAEAWKDTRSGIRMRSREEVLGLLAGFQVLEPGVVFAPQWRPEEVTPSSTRWMYAGVGRRV